MDEGGILVALVLGGLILWWTGTMIDRYGAIAPGPEKIAEWEAKQATKRRKQCVKEHPEWERRICDIIGKEEIKIGMTKEQVRLSWGEPKRINKTTTEYGVREQWVYSHHYLYFEHGNLDSWQSFGG